MATRDARDYGFGTDFSPTGTRTGGLPTAGAGATPFQLYSTPTPQVPGAVTQPARDVYGNPVVPVAAPYVTDTGYAPAAYGQAPALPAVDTQAAPVTPATPAAFAGSPLNTLYGIDSESNLTEDQKKLARMIQGKFDASLNRRDRELAQYGAPRLASFTEDEALARAMSLARGLNIPVQDALGMVQGSGPASRGGSSGGGGGGSGSTGRAPTSVTTPRATTQSVRNPAAAAAKTTPPGASASQAAKWEKIAQGLATYIPLILGKDGMAKLAQGGMDWIKSIYKETFGNNAPLPTDESLLQVFGQDSGGAVVGAPVMNPITGQLMGFQQPDGSIGPNPVAGFDTTPETLTFGGNDITGPYGEGADYGFPVGGDPSTMWGNDAGFVDPSWLDDALPDPYAWGNDANFVDPSWLDDAGWSWGAGDFGAEWGADAVNPEWLTSFWD